MIILKYLLTFVEVICCFLLIGVILIQKPKSHGLGLAFGSSIGETMFGTRIVNVLTKITIALSIIFLVNTTLLCLIWTKTRHTTRIMIPQPVKAERPSTPSRQPPPSGGVSETVPIPSSPESQPVIPLTPESTQPDTTKSINSEEAKSPQPASTETK
jgi:preprotein translocase subunit SecG